MRRWVLRGVVVVVVLVVVAAILAWRALQPAGVPAFYDAPDPIGTTKPGVLLRTEAIDPAPTGARLWRILYTSTSLDDAVVAVSGLVAAPATPAPEGGYPLVVVAHGTIGINRGCAPSIDPLEKADPRHTTYDALVGQYVAAGYAVVMADFQGLGVEGENAYLIGEIEGRNVLDSARAALAFPDLALQPGILIAGQSQGGHASLFAGQLAPTYAPDLDVLGVVAQAPATDLVAIFTGVLDAGKRGGIVSLPVMAADAYARHYPDVDIDRVLTPRGRRALTDVIERLCLIPTILVTQLATPQDLLQPDGLDVMRADIGRNIPGTSFDVPLFIAQGDADLVVPPTVTAAYVSGLCAAGADVTSRTYPATGHFEVVDASTPDVLAWMTAVRAGSPPPTTCAR